MHGFPVCMFRVAFLLIAVLLFSTLSAFFFSVFPPMLLLFALKLFNIFISTSAKWNWQQNVSLTLHPKGQQQEGSGPWTQEPGRDAMLPPPQLLPVSFHLVYLPRMSCMNCIDAFQRKGSVFPWLSVSLLSTTLHDLSTSFLFFYCPKFLQSGIDHWLQTSLLPISPFRPPHTAAAAYACSCSVTSLYFSQDFLQGLSLLMSFITYGLLRSVFINLYRFPLQIFTFPPWLSETTVYVSWLSSVLGLRCRLSWTWYLLQHWFCFTSQSQYQKQDFFSGHKSWFLLLLSAYYILFFGYLGNFCLLYTYLRF